MDAAKLVYSLKMPTQKIVEQKNAARPAVASTRSGVEPNGYAAGIVLIAGWLIPGLGHLLQGMWIRAVLLFAAIVSMFALGLAMHGKLYTPTNDLVSLNMLGFIGDLGSGGLYFLSEFLGWGQNIVQVVTEDYGAKFIVVAGLLNFIAAVDAHSIRVGRKR
ncbi:MAG: DUF6677 family protein [Acidobacteriaceae bacterium]